jgi:hypothetical protein
VINISSLDIKKENVRHRSDSDDHFSGGKAPDFLPKPPDERIVVVATFDRECIRCTDFR